MATEKKTPVVNPPKKVVAAEKVSEGNTIELAPMEATPEQVATLEEAPPVVPKGFAEAYARYLDRLNNPKPLTRQEKRYRYETTEYVAFSAYHSWSDKNQVLKQYPKLAKVLEEGWRLHTLSTDMVVWEQEYFVDVEVQSAGS